MYYRLCLCVLFFALSAENGAENKSCKWAAVEHLPEEGHGEIASKGVNPCAEAGLLKKQCCDKAHNRAHKADNHSGNRICDELRAVCGTHKGKSEACGKLFNHEKL